MAVQWYYGTGESRQGPFSAQQLQALAADGSIQPTDTVWKEGVAQGVPAHRVKHLFAASAVSAGADVANAERPQAATGPADQGSATAPATVLESASPTQPSHETVAGSGTAPEAPAPASSGHAETTAATALPQQSGASGGEKDAGNGSAVLSTGSGEVANKGLKQPAAQFQTKKGRAMAVRGAVIVSQDGTMVFFRKKCTQCGHEETGRNRLPIRNGVMRAGYFCPKCRKVRPVEIQGMC
jgi:GYF domain 2